MSDSPAHCEQGEYETRENQPMQYGVHAKARILSSKQSTLVVRHRTECGVGRTKQKSRLRQWRSKRASQVMASHEGLTWELPSSRRTIRGRQSPPQGRAQKVRIPTLES